MKKNILHLAREAGLTPKELSEDLSAAYACLCSFKMNATGVDKIEQETVIKNEHIKIVVTRKFVDENKKRNNDN